MDVHQLKLFLAVLECSSVTRAAKQVRLSKGAVSLQLHRLANELDVELFIRNGKRLEPTPSAMCLAEHAKSIVGLMNQIQHDFETDISKDTRPFYFATGVTTLICQLGGPLRELRKRLPNADIRVKVGVTEQIVAGLLARRFDLGLISLPVVDEHLRLTPLFDEELLLVRSSDKRVSGGLIRSITPSELVDVPFLLYPKKSNVRWIIDQFFEEIGITPRVLMEADDTQAIKGLVQAGFGYSILPEHALNEPVPYFEVLRVEGHHLSRTLALATAVTNYPRKLTEAVASILRMHLEEDSK